MSDETAALTRSFRVGRRTVTVTMPTPRKGEARCMTMEWTPDMPKRLSKREWRRYRAGRDAAVAELAELAGVKVMIVEM